jgi:hypothetical protein
MIEFEHLLDRPQGIDINVVGGFVEEEQIGAGLGSAFASRRYAAALLMNDVKRHFRNITSLPAIPK